jgi:DNA helicase HerA-like ATPase
MFDEAHMLFSDAPPVLVEKMEQVVRLIRSKGVGVYFCTQSPSDLPDSILAQLGHRVQHALRAYTPKDQKAVRAAAQSFRANPAFKTEEAITELGIGEALVSFLDLKGRPAQVERALVLPPESRVGAISPEERQKVIAASRLAGRYDTPIDRESAYEMLAEHFSQRQREADEAEAAKQAAKDAKEQERQRREDERAAKRQAKENPDVLGSVLNDVTKQAGQTLGRELGRSIIRGILGGLFGGKR